MNSLMKNDEFIFNSSKKIEKNFLDSINPINSIKEKKTFFQEHNKFIEYNPNFEYIKKIDYSKEKNNLIESEKIIGKKMIEKIFKTRICNLLKEIDLIEKINTKKFCNSSIKLFGKPKNSETRLAEELIQKKLKVLKKNIKPNQIKEKIQPLLNKTGFKAELKQNMSAKAAVNLTKKKLFINTNSNFSKSDVTRFKVHEIETHIYRYLNGLNQPFKTLSIGSGEEYLKTEEGLAIFNELKITQTNSFQEKIIAARLYAIKYALKHDFFDTFDELNKFFEKEDAYVITQRVKRGIPYCDKGAFTKDYCYFSGLLKITNFVDKGGKIEDLYYGKISIEEPKIVKKIKEINKPKYLPKHYTN
ncbi:MAG: tyrosine/phenylalanine carboxypeptidase domain-containing protein [archaeon]